MLECKALSKVYNGRHAVDNVTFTMRTGRVMGLVGPNGAGKSTLLKMFTGLIWPTGGTVSIDGFDVQQNQRRALANVGAIIEWPSFYLDLSARRNLDILSGGNGTEYERKLREIIHMVNLDGRLSDKVGRFSTGMKQRLGIALALLPDSKFIILDEPTNGLDPLGLIEIRRIIRDYNQLFGTTILVTTHLLPEIEQVAHDIAIINRGRLIAHGEIKTLLAGDNILKVFASPLEQAFELIRKSELPVEFLQLIEGECVQMKISDEECAAEVNTLLVKNGIKISRLGIKRKTLESFFLESTGDDQHVS
ncbi:MAG: ABC transporter ATP-binding protein [Victivallaceae bacterium]|nr:ABC transporter ATP-binding protein [Victivallaceae bacterium]MDD4318320.1 ABC transporter ATP-binding protein [Victivallaceae bacterium]